MEMLDILNEQLKIVGTASREEAHQRGLIHQVVHLWVAAGYRKQPALAFQQRAADKKEFPGYYDIAVGGHVDAGEQPLEAILREAREEIGLSLKAEDIAYLGSFRDDIVIDGTDDRELAHVYLYRCPSPAFHPGPEVDRMVYVLVKDFEAKEAGAQVIPAYTEAGERLMLTPDQWCRHPGEYGRFLRPALEAR